MLQLIIFFREGKRENPEINIPRQSRVETYYANFGNQAKGKDAFVRDCSHHFVGNPSLGRTAYILRQEREINQKNHLVLVVP